MAGTNVVFNQPGRGSPPYAALPWTCWFSTGTNKALLGGGGIFQPFVTSGTARYTKHIAALTGVGYVTLQRGAMIS
jgi:hypothetical protein